EAAARHLSFTKAAAELFLTQSAVSRQIQALEEFIGVPLFERRHKALALTDAGQAYYRVVAASLGELREATRKLRESRTGHVLTVTTTVSFASIWLVPRLARFRKEHPRVDVRITATHNVVDMEREGIDLAIRDCPLDRVPAGSTYLVSEHLAVVASPQYLREAKAQKKPYTKPADLRHHALLTLHDPTGRWPWLSWPAWLEARGVEDFVPESTITLDQYDQVIQACLHGQGVAVGRMTLVEQHIRNKNLVALFGQAQRVQRGFHAVYARDAQGRPEVRQFVDWLKQELER
ncbi:MAG TPA: LysR substrate-binding domain-containing protein, partial [Usitatibacter sp.]|nr:LysR substrate-binding domain-containing protein [Usitatibacter sp.]